MTLEVGKSYVDLARKGAAEELIYVGPTKNHEIFQPVHTNEVRQVMHNRVRTDIVPWNSHAHRPLEVQQMWKRTRHDYTGQIAQIIIPPFENDGTTWVVYTVHYGNGNPGPHLKTEKDFRRIFGEYIEK